MYEDGPTRAALKQFSKDYVTAQDSIELAESLAPTVADTILTVVLTAATGVGGTVIVARAGQALFKQLGRLLVSLGKVLKKSELSKHIVSKLSNKPERFEIRRPEALKLSEPKRVEGNGNDGTMGGESVVPDSKGSTLIDSMEPAEAKRYQEYWNTGGDTAAQVSPGIRVSHTETVPSSRAGEVYERTTYYDEFGRRRKVTDYTDHSMSDGHTNPHDHYYDEVYDNGLYVNKKIKNPETGSTTFNR